MEEKEIKEMKGIEAGTETGEGGKRKGWRREGKEVEEGSA